MFVNMQNSQKTGFKNIDLRDPIKLPHSLTMPLTTYANNPDRETTPNNM